MCWFWKARFEIEFLLITKMDCDSVRFGQASAINLLYLETVRSGILCTGR